MAGEAAAFRSLTPEVQQRVARRMVQGIPSSTAFSNALREAQTSDFVARDALKIHDSMVEEYNSGPSINDTISQGIEPTQPQLPPATQPIQEQPNYPQQQPGLPPINENPTQGNEFQSGQDKSFTDIFTDNPKTTATVTGLAAAPFAMREFVKRRRAQTPNTIPSAEDLASQVEFALTGGQEKGQRDLLDNSVTPNKQQSPDTPEINPRQADMFANGGDPRQQNLAIGKGELQPFNDSRGNIVGYTDTSGDGKTSYYDRDKQFLGTNIDEVKASVTGEIPSIPKKRTTKKKKVVKVAADFALADEIRPKRRQREKGASRFVDKDVDKTGEIKRVITNPDGSKTAVNKDHKRWREVIISGSSRNKDQKVIIDEVSGLVYDAEGFQVTGAERLSKLKSRLKKVLKSRKLAKVIKVIF